MAFVPRKLLDNERQHGKLFSYGEELPETRCQTDRGINAVEKSHRFLE